ncbi:MAG: FHA domain-containing protein [Acidimicrobiia bacterium]|nr:FHA domain-containing protein [Acidimicrobiia bacterium]
MADDRAPQDQSDDEATLSFDPMLEARRLRNRQAVAGIPGLKGYALVVMSGPRRGLYWELPEGETVAGRNTQAEIFLDDVTVSRDHAAFIVEDRSLLLRDLGSTNGTYVNGERADEAALHPGDEVFIGRFHFTVARS